MGRRVLVAVISRLYRRARRYRHDRHTTGYNKKNMGTTISADLPHQRTFHKPTAHSTSYCTFNKLLHIQQAYRTFHKPTAHSTSYYTLDKLPHIRQASTHSTSYRTNTLKSIPPISVYAQVRSHRTYYKRTVRSTNIPSVVQTYRP